MTPSRHDGNPCYPYVASAQRRPRCGFSWASSLCSSLRSPFLLSPTFARLSFAVASWTTSSDSASVRGGLVLTALDPSRQAFESPNVDRDQRFSLVGDLLDELKALAGQEVEVTGQRILVQDVRDPILIEPPQDPGGFPGAGVIEPRRGFPGAGQQTPPGRQRDMGAAAAPQVTLVVTAYKSFSAFCRR